MSNNFSIKVEATLTFKRNLDNLSKKYRHILNDIKPIIKQLETGDLPGKRISGINYQVFKY